MNKKLLVLLIVAISVIPLFSGCLEEERKINNKPSVKIINPKDGETVSKIVQIYGIASDPDDDKSIKRIEIMVNNSEWQVADGTTEWSYEWTVYDLENGYYDIQVRAWDGALYSDIDKITVKILNPIVEPGGNKWALFVMAANFPEDNESKLGNGGLYLAEEMAFHFIEKFNYPTSNIWILFDDGWIRSKNGFGERLSLLSERPHIYNITYGSAKKENVISTLEYIIANANNFEDSEVFIWISGHGYGDIENNLTGGKVLERSAVYLWDEELLEDRELGVILSSLKSNKVCIIIDACFSGGFADKSIYDFPTLFLLRSKIPRPGRVVITSTSKFRAGYTSVTEGPLFTNIWFNGIKTGEADGFRSGFRNRGRPSRLGLFRDGKVSVEEAFYYTRYILRTDENLKEYSQIEPQINDQYPRRGKIGSIRGLILGQ